jgi:outer membrane receptor for ferrienterochelin and colicin
MWRAITVLFVFLLLVAVPAGAQTSAGGSVRGLVKDEQGGVLPGVTVTATSPSAPRPQTVVTDLQGVFRLIDLQPGSYTVSTELAGFSKWVRADIDVRAGLNIEINVTMKVGSVQETVQVTADTPMLEVQTPVQAVNISGEMQRSLPLTAKRDWYNYLEITPSVTNRSVDQSGGQVYMLRGSEIEGHVFQLDGADMGSFRQSRADYVGLSTDAIQDVQVKTGAVDASAPLGVGVVVNVATQSGTNRFKGAIGTVYTPMAWNGNNANAGGTTAANSLFQPDGSLGGPIIKDRLFFFGAVRYSRNDLGISRSPQQVTYLQALQPGFTPFNQENRFKYEYIKGTAQISPKHQLIAFFQNDFSPQDANWAYDGSKVQRLSYGGYGVGTRLSSVWSSTVTTKLAVSWNNKSYSGNWNVYSGYQGTGPSQQVYGTTAISGGHLVGSGLVAELDNATAWTISPTSKYTIQGDLTWYKSGLAGTHEFEIGFFLQPRDRNSNTTQYPDNGFAYQDDVLRDPNNPSAGYIPFHQRVYDVSQLTTSSVQAKDYALYAQDAWRPVDPLSINVGVRADWIRTDDLLFGQNIQKGWNVGPRLGFTYQLTKDHMNVLRGSFAIVHDMPQSIYIASAGTNSAGYTDYYDNNGDGTYEMVLTTPASNKLNPAYQFDPNFHQPKIREYVLGYGRQFPGQLSFNATVIRRDYLDRWARVDVNSIYDGNVFVGYENPAQNAIYLNTNNIWNWFVYTGLELSVSKRTSKMQFMASYTRGWQHIDGTWQPNDPASFIQPSAFPNDGGLGTWRGNGINSLAYAADTRSPSWQKHIFRAGGSYNLPWQFTAAASFTFLSGPYSGPIYTTISAPDPQFGPATVTLSNGRVVANPLATTYRFAYATRGDGQLKAPNLLYLNLRIQRDFKIGGSQKVLLMLDAFNVTNNATDQQFLDGGNVLTSPNYALKNGVWQGQNRQAPRVFQIGIRYAF